MSNSKSEQIKPWILFHVPHDSTEIPEEIRNQFLLNEYELRQELLWMTDHHTLDLFTAHVPAHQIVAADVSRLVVDLERFPDDEKELMARKGMGVIYNLTSQGKPLRRPLLPDERNYLLNRWYYPHHQALERAAQSMIEEYGRCLVIDCHSYPSKPLPYESDPRADRPHICLGTDSFHTDNELIKQAHEHFSAAKFAVNQDTPFQGVLVPASSYKIDSRVGALMLEIRRDTYMDEKTGERHFGFDTLSRSLMEFIYKL